VHLACCRPPPTGSGYCTFQEQAEPHVVGCVQQLGGSGKATALCPTARLSALWHPESRYSPYTVLEATMWSPAEHRARRVPLMAAMPEAVAYPACTNVSTEAIALMQVVVHYTICHSWTLTMTTGSCQAVN
jgi:hypothetical protein